MREVGIFAKTFAGPLPDVLRTVEDHGLSRIQFNFSCAGLPSMPDAVDAPARFFIQQALAQSPVTLEAVSGTFNMIHPDRSVRVNGLRQLGVIAAQCSWLGTNLLTLCTGTRHQTDMWTAHPDNDRPDAWYDLRQSLDKALELAEHYDLYLGIEPETANVINTVEKAAQLLKEVRSPRLRIIFDPANLFEHEPLSVVRQRIARGLDQLGDAIRSVHAKDRDASGQVVAAGTGRLPYDDFIQGLRAIDYRGNLILHGLSAAEVSTSVAFIRQLLHQT